MLMLDPLSHVLIHGPRFKTTSYLTFYSTFSGLLNLLANRLHSAFPKTLQIQIVNNIASFMSIAFFHKKK